MTLSLDATFLQAIYGYPKTLLSCKVLQLIFLCMYVCYVFFYCTCWLLHGLMHVLVIAGMVHDNNLGVKTISFWMKTMFNPVDTKNTSTD
jgi:hypothetical protein